jgi:hypothetical protein
VTLPLRPTPELTAADRALLRSFQIWGGAAGSRFWKRFRAGWRESLERAATAYPPEDGAAAERALRQALRAQARPDFARVHPSWWTRALRDESPSVQWLITARANPSLQPMLLRELGLDPADLRPSLPANPDALRWALSLWDERIVGDLPEGPEDPPVIVALAGLALREVVALARACGLAKRALAAPNAPPLVGRARDRFDHFQRVWGERDQSSLADARRLFHAELKARHQRRGWGRLGLVTLGCLLARAEPYRARWALQHLPYSVGRRIRPAIRDRGDFQSFWEGEILRVAWERLVAEGQIRSMGGLTRDQRYV